MKKQSKFILYVILLIVGLMIFNLQVFVFEAPDGNLGFLLCLFCVGLISGSAVGMCKLNNMVKSFVFNALNALFLIW